MKPLHIGMLIFPNMTALDFAAPFELLSRLPGVKVHVLWKRIETVTSDIGGLYLPSLSLPDCPPLDVLFVGGGPGVNALMEDADILTFLAQQGAQARWITSVCTGALVLGAAGLLQGYRATTHWSALDILPLFGAIPEPTRTVQDQNRVSGGGVTAGLDFGLLLASLLCDAEEAQFQQLMLEYNPQPPFHSGSPAQATSSVRERAEQVYSTITAERRVIAERVVAGW